MSKRKRLTQYGKRARRGSQLPLNLALNLDNEMFFPNTNQIDQSQNPPPLPPKPASQKAASMPSEPADSDIHMVMEVTGIPREQAIRYLKVKNSDVNAAVSAVFEGEDISKAESAQQWDESAWGAGKDGDTDKNMQYLHPLASSAAATRPNSPAPSQRSNMHPSSKQEEDNDLAQAMAMSQGEYGGAFQQETGRIGSDGQAVTFGPANKPYYAESQWGMVTTKPYETNEIVPDVDVEQRGHNLGEPRLLKFLPNGDYTPNFLTIVHAINGARQALLMPNHLQANYGQDAEWWRGHAVSLPRIVNLEDQSAAEPQSDKYDELITEVQRIMAFLSASNRSYGSVGALTQVEAIKGANPATTASRTLLELFLQNWIIAAMAKSGSEGAGLSNLFTTIVGTNSSQGMDTPDLSLIDIAVTIGEDSKSDLFEQLDDLLWDTDADNTMSDNYIERPAEVLVMRLHQQNATANPKLNVEVPSHFYVDKYLPENIEATRATRMQMANGKKRISKIESIEKKLKSWKHPKKNEQLDAGDLINHAWGHFSGENRKNVVDADKSNHIPDDMKDNKPGYQEIADKLEKLMASIRSKLEVLADEKEKTRRAISEMSKAPPPGLQPTDLKHRYTLRGVATKPNITYVLCDATSGDDDSIMFDEDTTPSGMQWWRMEYEASATGSKVTKTKAADYDVIRAVELEHSSALLVYASDLANEGMPDDGSLPPALQEFVEKDNQLFAAELDAERNKPPAYDLTDIPRQSIEHVERTSLDSTRVEGGGSDHGGPSTPSYEDDAFMDHHGFGLGPGLKQGYRQEDDEVHEIMLDDMEEDGRGVEMTERVHQPLIPGLKPGGGDAEMEDVSQDQGVGGDPSGEGKW